MQRHRAGDLTARMDEIDDQEIARLTDAARTSDHPAQRLRYRGAGIEKIDIDAAGAVMSRCERLRDAPLPARPAHAPCIHLADAVRACFAQELGEPLVAQPAAGGKRVVVVV